MYLRGLGALDAVLGLMKRHIDVDTVCANACGVIWNFAADRSNQRYLKVPWCCAAGVSKKRIVSPCTWDPTPLQ